MQISKNERFKKEYNLFVENISLITDDRIKNEMNHLLKEMVDKVRLIDQQHEELFNGSRLATDSVAGHRSSLLQIRQQLNKKLEQCKKSGLLKITTKA